MAESLYSVQNGLRSLLDLLEPSMGYYSYKNQFCECVCMNVYVMYANVICVCAVHVPASAHVQRKTLSVLPYQALLYSLETGSLTDPGARLAASRPHDLLPGQCCVCRCICIHCWLSV